MAPAPGPRVALAAAACALAALAAAPLALAEEITPVYFGNGCFWGRQFDYVNTEKALGRTTPDAMSALAGYAGGRAPAPASAAGKVCYYRGPSGTVYEDLGHAETVQVELRGDPTASSTQFRAFADTYFKQFRKTPFGMMRLDPQDAGPGYRNVIGLPGGVNSPLFATLQEANVNGMRLLPGSGNEFDASGRASEGDEFNTVWVVDSTQLGFNRAEKYHQFHNGIGEAFPKSYTRDLRQAMAASGKIDPTGCPEFVFF